jgi:uncharacterized protein YecE (DUF72 family)
VAPCRIGTAGWNVPTAIRTRFAADGTQLQRYASRLNAAEINSCFYRSHKPDVYLRWARSVPSSFRFAVKVPKIITHDRGLLRCREPLVRFLDETAILGRKRGPLLVQLPPSFAFDARRVGRFFELLRALHQGPVVCEPRHATWLSPPADDLLTRFEVARVAADPVRAAGLDRPGGWRKLTYFRWHGSPRPYFSPYSREALTALAESMGGRHGDVWCIFDNTGSGAAAANALELAERMRRR